jgi:hypothetical protein
MVAYLSIVQIEAHRPDQISNARDFDMTFFNFKNVLDRIGGFALLGSFITVSAMAVIGA